MRHKFLLLVLFAATFSWISAKANETEPNDTKAQANTLVLNGSNTGSIGTSTDVDWWKVTTTGDGKLDVTLTISNSLYCWASLYDNDGSTVLVSNNTNGTVTISADGLATGTYYIKVYPFYSGQMPNYTIANTLTVPTQANDAEPDSTRAQALVLPLNGSKTGHINYYYNNHRDSSDWYKVTTNGDGLLKLTLTSGNGQYIWAFLYDNNGVTQLNAQNTAGSIDISTDGLATGTYYIKIVAFYNTGFAPYTISNTLTKPVQANDPEPDSTRALALTLPLNSSTTGHIDYYYNNHRDSADWYKVTTTGDGRLRLTLTSNNGQYVWAYLYDNNGTTQLNAQNTSGTIDINTDGLQAGTYYVRINSYYNNGFVPYTLSDSLFVPTQANDNEPNDTKATAQTLAVNSTVTGHVDYYYNNKRDSADWYKLTMLQDGMIHLNIASNNGQYVWAYLYDNDGVTQINAQNTASSVDINTDGLAAGTYYIKVISYYNNGFVPYTLQNSLVTYTYAADAEPDNYAAQAKTLLANIETPGHVNFYYNGNRDAVDWWKVNYTGSGALSIVVNQEAWKVNNTLHYYWLQVYKDTTAAPIYNNNSSSASNTVNLSALTQGYYYIKIFPYYGNEFISYSLNPTFTQVTKAKITVVTVDTSAACDSTNSITLKCTKSSAPYTVQLYRYNLPYGNPKIVNNTKAFSFNGLPHGLYSARAYGDGATGTAYGKTANIELIPTPTNPSTTAIKSTQARLNWVAVSCANYFRVQYRKATDTAWTTKNTVGNTSFLVIKNLTASTQYYWRVASADSANKATGFSAFTDSISFTTAAAFADAQIAEDATGKTNISGNNDLLVYPNPVRSSFTIQFTSSKPDSKVSASLRDIYGNIVWSSNNSSASALNGTKVDASKLAGGIYILQVTDLNTNAVITKKVVVSK